MPPSTTKLYGRQLAIDLVNNVYRVICASPHVEHNGFVEKWTSKQQYKTAEMPIDNQASR